MRKPHVAIAVVSLVAASVVMPITAFAVEDASALVAELAHCAGSPLSASHILDDDVIDPTAQLATSCTARIDLAGHALTLRNIVIMPGTTLTITDTSAGRTGRVTVDASGASGVPGIRTHQATLVLEAHGTLAKGGHLAAGIGGGSGEANGTVWVSGANTVAIGSSHGAGIGGGYSGAAGTITITGNATSATGGAAGIGSGNQGGTGTISIAGDATVATGGLGGAGIGGAASGGGNITISGNGTVATGGEHGAGIGAGVSADGGTISITGNGTIATGGKYGAGIGGGHADIHDVGGNGGTISIAGHGTIATGGAFGAGIGGGSGGDGGVILITGDGTVATGEVGAAGIGGGGDGHGGDITIAGNGTHAHSTTSGAGIGGGSGWKILFGPSRVFNSGTIRITGNDTRATGGVLGGAGIGGALLGGVDDITISGARTFAQGGNGGAGIGSGAARDESGVTLVPVFVGTITISGAGTTAIGGTNYGSGIPVGAAGIGAGSRAAGGTVVIAAGGEVTAMSDDPAVSAVGGAMSQSFGTLTVHGTLRVPTGIVVVGDTVPGPEIVVGSTGIVTGTTLNPSAGASFSGAGQIANGGAIQLATASVTGGTPAVTVTGNHSVVQFPGVGEVAVFASTMAAGARTVPVAMPTPPAGQLFMGWQRSPGVAFTTASVLPGASAGAAVPVPLTAVFAAAAIDALSIDVEAGATLSADVRLRVVGTGELAVPLSGWTVVAPAQLTASIGGSPAQLTVGSQVAGSSTVEVTATLPQGTITTIVPVVVRPAVLHSLDVRLFNWSGTEARVGDTLTLLADGFDPYGNSHGDVTGASVVRSDQSGDVVVGNTVRFAHASPHTLTVEHVATGVTGSIVVEVHPLPAMTPTPTAAAQSATGSLGATGADGVDGSAMLAVLLLLAGATVLALRRATARRVRA